MPKGNQRQGLKAGEQIVASGTVQSTTLPPPPPVPLESRERERIIRRQLARTGLQVRLVDLASSLAIWVIGVVVLFLLMALFDHFFGLGRVGRHRARSGRRSGPDILGCIIAGASAYAAA